jgi:hypothetical protein
MAETADKKTKKEVQKAKKPVQIETGAIEIDEANPFTPDEIARMLKVKSEIEKGRYSDITNEHKKLLFVQWMIDHGKLNS